MGYNVCGSVYIVYLCELLEGRDLSVHSVSKHLLDWIESCVSFNYSSNTVVSGKLLGFHLSWMNDFLFEFLLFYIYPQELDGKTHMYEVIWAISVKIIS